MSYVPVVESSASDASSANKRARNEEWAAIVVLALLGVVTLLRLLALSANSTELYMDEAQYWAWSLEPAFGYYSKPPLIAWIIAASTSVCGDGELCVRLPSVLLHAATAAVIFLIGRKLHSDLCGVIAAAAYATLPGVSFSAGIISTDVPLLFFWALALIAFAHLIEKPTLAMAALLGFAVGLGLNAKYAMAYFILCAAIYFVAAPERRSLLRRPHLWIALALAALMITPNVIWNIEHGFVTFSHTADNAKWTGSLLHPAKALEFLVTQFGVMGPILFGALLVIVWRTRRLASVLPEPDRLLIAFSLPVIALITVQALLSRAHANWAATAYIAAVVLVTAVMIRERAWTWLVSSLAINSAIGVAIALATWQAGNFTLPGIGDPFARTLGNRNLAAVVDRAVQDRAAAGAPIRSIVADDRAAAAALLYYARDLPVPIKVWRATSRPRHHFDLTRPFLGNAASEPALLLTGSPAPEGVLKTFGTVERLGARDIAAGRFTSYRTELFVVSNYNGR